MLRDITRPRHIRVFSMKHFHLLLSVLHTFVGFPSILILHAAFRFHNQWELSHWFIPASDLWRIRDDLTFDDPFYLPLTVSLSVLRISWRLFAIWSGRGSVVFQKGNMIHGMNPPLWPHFQLVYLTAFLSKTLKGPYSFWLDCFEDRLVYMFLAFHIRKSVTSILGHFVPFQSFYFFIDCHVVSRVCSTCRCMSCIQ